MRALRVAIMGSCGVGKSALVLRFMSGEYAEIYDPTIEDTYRKQFEVDGTPCMLDILDTAGSDQYPALNEVALTDSHAFVLVFSLAQSESLDDIGRIRADISKYRLTEKLPMVVVGAKSDLANYRQVTPEAAADFAEAAGCPYIETSARNDENIAAVFEEIARQSRKLAAARARSRAGRGRRHNCIIM